MKNIHTLNQIMLPYPAQFIWIVITNLSSYPEWWPASIKLTMLQLTDGLLGSQIELRPYGGQPFVCELVEVVSETKLIFKYSGIYEGTGIWTISEINGQCRVGYEIMLEIRNIWIRILALILPVSRIHSRLMMKVLSGLERYLKEISRRKESSGH